MPYRIITSHHERTNAEIIEDVEEDDFECWICFYGIQFGFFQLNAAMDIIVE